MHRIIAIVVCRLAAIALIAASLPMVRAELVPYFGGPDSSKLSLNQSLAARNAFLATLSNSGVENLETLGGQTNPTLTFGTITTAHTGFPNGVNSAFQYSVSGLNFIWDTEGVNDWLEFTKPVTAFGSYIVQSGDGESAQPTSTPPNTLKFLLENTELGTSKEVVVHDLGPDWPFYNVIFVGVTDTQPFNRISFVESYDHDGILFDDLVAGYVVPTLPGDFDKNDVVDEGDLAEWQAHFGEIDHGDFLGGDGDGDGDVDGADLLIWQRQFGENLAGMSAAVSTVPEPAGLVSLLIAAVVAGLKRRV